MSLSSMNATISKVVIHCEQDKFSVEVTLKNPTLNTQSTYSVSAELPSLIDPEKLIPWPELFVGTLLTGFPSKSSGKGSTLRGLWKQALESATLMSESVAIMNSNTDSAEAFL